MEWVQIVSDYGALGILTLIAFLFATGRIVSAKTMAEMKKTYEENMKAMCASFDEQLETLKEVIQIMKRQNGIK